MKNQLKVLRILVLFLFAGAEGRLHAATVIDQEQPAIDIRVGGLAIGGNSQQNLAQVVTAGVSGFLTEVRFPISCQSADLIVEIQGVTNGMPDSIILNSQTFAGADLPSFFPSPGVVSFRSFVFSTRLFFSAGDQFAIVLKSTGTTTSQGCGIFQGPAGDSYAGGNAFFDARPNPEGIWVCICDFAGARIDLPFQTVVAPPITEVDIDIRPGEFPNNINRTSQGKIQVAILSTKDFDASTQVDKESITFGSTGEEAQTARCESVDVNGDGLLDLVCLFDTQQTSFRSSDTVGVLIGRTLDGIQIRGTDSVRIVH